jgi:ribonuclease R
MYEFNNQQNTNPNQQAATQLLDEQARISSKNELIAIKCERDVNSMKFAEYMSKHIGEEYEGYITTVSSYGIFVQLANTVEGLVKLGNLPSDFYNFNQKTNELKGQKKGLVFSLGIKVLVKVIAADKLTRKIEFALTKILNKR